MIKHSNFQNKPIKLNSLKSQSKSLAVKSLILVKNLSLKNDNQVQNIIWQNVIFLSWLLQYRTYKPYFYCPSKTITSGFLFPLGRILADIQSYEDDRDAIEPLFSDKDIKSETLSPTRKTATRSDAAKSEPFDISNIDFSKGLFDELLEPKSAKSVSELSSKVWSNLPYTREDIIHMDIDEFNNVISALDPLQQHIGKDIRRRGKNKIAARNCRKRKVEAIDQLETVVDQTDKERKALLNERAMLLEETADIVRKTAYLYEHIFKNLRDERGQPYSNDKFALTYTGDGSVYLVPKTPEQKSITVR